MSLLSSLVKRHVISLPSHTTIYNTAHAMKENAVGCMLVMDDGKLLGIFTERDNLNRVVAKNKDPQSTKLADVMSTDIRAISIDESVENCFKKMQETKCRHLPVLEKGKVVGMVTMRDILEWLMSEIQDENEALLKYIKS